MREAPVVKLVASIVLAAVATAAIALWPPPAATTVPELFPTCDGAFDFPVAPIERYYDAQPFGENHHLGNDWNGTGGGDTDLGDPVLAVADGVVTEAVDHGGGWGNVVRIVHPCTAVESLYAHLDEVHVAAGTTVARGQPIGTIGTAHGRYRAHLHFELRDRYLPLGPGYAADRTGYLDPAAYIRARRSARR